MMTYRRPTGPPCPMCRSDMVLSPTRIERHEVWYCPKCGFIPNDRVLDMEWLESTALGWFNRLGKKQNHIRLFITGLTQCTVAFLKSYDVVYMHRPNPPTLSLMFWDRDSESYVESRWDE